MLQIKSLEKEIVSTIRSTCNITSFTQCVTELVLNSIDAKSTSIAIRMNMLRHRIQVVDNGEGITLSNLEVVGKRYMTNKCYCLEDLHKNTKYFGFRGEALASICDLATYVTIVSKAKNSDATYKKVIKDNEYEITKINKRPSYGTTITVDGLFSNFPVRQQNIKEDLEYEYLKRTLENLIVICPNVSFTLRNDASNSLVLTSPKHKSVKDAIKYLHQDIESEKLYLMKYSKGKYIFDVLFYKELYCSSKGQYLYVNRRPVSCLKIQKFICTVFQKNYIARNKESKDLPYISKNKYPFYVVNIKCPHSEVDLLLTPSKSQILFKNIDAVMQCMEKIMMKYFGSSTFLAPKKCHNNNWSENVKSECGVSQIAGAIRGVGYRRRNSTDKKDTLLIEDDSMDDFQQATNKTKKRKIQPKKDPPPISVKINTNKLVSKGKMNDKYQNVENKRPDSKHKKTDSSCEICEGNLEKSFNFKQIFSQTQQSQKDSRAKKINSSHENHNKQLETGFNFKQIFSQAQQTQNRFFNISPSSKNETLFTVNPENIKKGKELIMDMFLKSTQVYSCHDSDESAPNADVITSSEELASQNNDVIRIETEGNYVPDRKIDTSTGNMKNENIDGDIEYGSQIIDITTEQDENFLPPFSFFKNENKSGKKMRNKNLKHKLNITDEAPLIPHKLSKELNYESKCIQTTFVDHSLKQIETTPDRKKSKCIQTTFCDLKDKPNAMNHQWNQEVKNNPNRHSNEDINNMEILSTNYNCFFQNKCDVMDRKYLAPQCTDTNNCKKEMRLRKDDFIHPNYHEYHNIFFKQDNFPVCYFDLHTEKQDRKSLKKYVSNYNYDFSNINELPIKTNDMFVGNYYLSFKDETVKLFDCNALEKSNFLKPTKTWFGDKKFIHEQNVLPNLACFNITSNNSSYYRLHENKYVSRKALPAGYKFHLENNNLSPIGKAATQAFNLKSNHCDIQEVKNYDTNKKLDFYKYIQSPPRDIVGTNTTILNDTKEMKSHNNLMALSSTEIIYLNEHPSSKSDKNTSRYFESNTYDWKFTHIRDTFDMKPTNEKSCVNNTENINENCDRTYISFSKFKPEHESTQNYIKKARTQTTLDTSQIFQKTNSFLVTSDEHLKKENHKVGGENKEQSSVVSGCKTNEGNFKKKTEENICDTVPTSSGEKNNDNDCLEKPTDKVNEWVKAIDQFGTTFYFNKRTGMTTFCSPKSQEPFNLVNRFEFLPKGLSPILIESKKVDRIMSPGNKEKLHQAIIESYENELLTIKWQNYVSNEDPAKFFDEIYKNKTKLFESAVPVVEKSSKLSNGITFDKALFENVVFIGQMDLKFIVAFDKLHGYLLLFDQHAVHERICLEKLQQGYKNSYHKLGHELTIFLQNTDLKLLVNHQSYLEDLGLTFEVMKNGIRVITVPLCIWNRTVKENDADSTYMMRLVELLIDQVLSMARESKSLHIPPLMENIINTEACRGAIKFGDPLTKSMCCKLLEMLGKCILPFQCAHGRPTLTPLLTPNSSTKLMMKKPNLKKLIVK